jgi:hypothetical protein
VPKVTAEQVSELMKLGPQLATAFNDGNAPTEPMDGDDVDDFTETIKIVLNYHQGNLTDEEFAKALGA